MSKDGQEKLLKPDRAKRRGHPIYESNPSAEYTLPVRVRSKKPSKIGESYVISREGEVLADGAMAFIEETEVDTEHFLKIYLAGIRQYGQLSQSGATLFEYVYRELSGKDGKDKDTVTINYLLAQRWMESLSRRTYDRGLKELLDKEFIFRSLSTDNFYVNIRYMFNGDRLVIAKAYRRKGTITPAQIDSDEPCIDVDSTASE
jgi:hypothetical protein